MSFGELDTVGARSVLRRYSTEWFEAAKKRKAGQHAGFPRRKKALLPVRWYHGMFRIEGDHLTVPVARGAPPLVVRLARAIPYAHESVRSLTLLAEAGRLYVDVTAALSPEDHDLDPGIVAGVDPGIIHPFAVVAGDEALLVSGRVGACGPSATCTSPTPRRGRGGWVARPPPGASGGPGAGASSAAPSAAGRPATAVASARDITRQRRRWSPGRSTTRWARSGSGTPRGSATAMWAGARTCGFAGGGAPI